MTALCQLFPPTEPINYNDCEEDDNISIDEGRDDEFNSDTEMSQTVQNNYPLYTDDSTVSTPRVQLRNTNSTPGTSPRRPRSFVEARVNELQNLIAADAQPKSVAIHKDEVDLHGRIGPLNIPQQFRNTEYNRPAEGKSSILINRTSSSPVSYDRIVHASEESTPQDSLRNLRSPVVFSESSSPRRLSPITYPNIGNMNPRHMDIEQYWNKENCKLSPARSPSVTSNTNSKEDYNQNYCNSISNTNSPVENFKELYVGNIDKGLQYDPQYGTPLQIDVDPVSIIILRLETHTNKLNKKK